MELAPLHIHVIMLDALQLEPGHSFLEVGCATGFLVCLAAYMVSPSGRAVGLEVRKTSHPSGRVFNISWI